MSIGKALAVLAALLAAGQPVRAASTVRVVPVSYNLGQTVAISSASGSATFAASKQTAAESKEENRRRGPSTTVLVVGGVVLLAVIVAAAVAGAMPQAGPPKGAFD